jgi:hypothetical protein
MQSPEPLVRELCSLDVEIAIKKLKRYKSQGADQIPSGLTQAGGNTLSSETHELINSIWIKEELPQQWKEFVTVFIYTESKIFMNCLWYAASNWFLWDECE